MTYVGTSAGEKLERPRSSTTTCADGDAPCVPCASGTGAALPQLNGSDGPTDGTHGPPVQATGTIVSDTLQVCRAAVSSTRVGDSAMGLLRGLGAVVGGLLAAVGGLLAGVVDLLKSLLAGVGRLLRRLV